MRASAAPAAPILHSASGGPGRARASGLLGKLSKGDLACLTVLFVIPVLAFAVPAALGHPVLPGDDAAQNFPMRVLVGRQLRAGHLPVLDMGIWSGAPLLAGWNAGAAYPFTWLFAVLPGAVAWAANLMLTSWAAGMGLYVFLRATKLRPLPAVLGAITFAFAGAMDAQVVHFGLVAGVSWIPLQLLALLEMSEASEPARRARWSALLAISAAMTLLAGEPRAIDVALFVTGPYALWRLSRCAGRRRSMVGFGLLAALAAVALGSLQLLPGLHAISQSQRAPTGFSFNLYNSGSYPLSWLLLLLEPNLLGGSGSFGSPQFLGSYNLTEVTAYVGILPLVAAFALPAGLRRRRGVPEWVIWEVVAAIGIVLALGGSTPAWHLLVKIPLFGSQRLQNRNILVTDLALGVLLAFWLDAWLGRRSAGGGKVVAGTGEANGVAGVGEANGVAGVGEEVGADGASSASKRERLIGLLPALGALSVGVLSIAWGAGMLRWLGVTRAMASQDGGLRPWFVPTIVIGLAAAGLVVFGQRMSARKRRVVTSLLVAGDIACFGLTSLFLVAPSSAQSPATGSARHAPAFPADRIGVPGRFAVYDPALLHGSSLQAVGAPDANLLVGGSSLQGYSAIVGGRYAEVTGAHLLMGGGQDTLSPRAIGDGALDQLDPGPLLTLPQYLVVKVTEAKALETAGSPMSPVRAAGRRDLTAGGSARWYFGEDLSVSSLRVPSSSQASGVRLGLVSAGGALTWLAPPAVSPRQQAAGSAGHPYELTVRLPGALSAVGIVARSRTPVSLGIPLVTTRSGVSFEVDGVIEGAVSSGQWRYYGQDGPFSVFAATHPVAPLSLHSLAGGSAAGAAVRALSGPRLAPTSAAVSSSGGVEVVRAVAYMPGWFATWQPAGSSRDRALHVTRYGLVQGVAVPAGRGVLRWIYRAPGLRSAELAAGAGLLVLIGLLVAGARGSAAARRSAATRRSAAARAARSGGSRARS